MTLRTAEGCSFLAEARNLSEGGLGLQHIQVPLAVGDNLVLTFTLPGVGRLMEMKATVVWSRAGRNSGHEIHTTQRLPHQCIAQLDRQQSP